MRLMKLALFAASLSLVACGPSVEQQCAGANDPATCAAMARSGGDVKDYLLGGLAGAALASAVSRPSAQPIVVHQAASDRSYGNRAYARPPRTKTVTTTTRRSLFGGHTVTRTTTSFRPSYRSRR